MPFDLLSRRAGLAACVLAIAALLAVPAASPAASVVANVRVETSGTVLDPGAGYATGTTRIRTDPGADCFGSDTGGSGNRVTVAGPTALGIVKDAAAVKPSLRPISVSDHFWFGLAVCGFGGQQAGGSAFWYLKVNHVGAQVGGDQFILHRGDRVLWYLSPGFPPPPELGLGAPAGAQPGVPFPVRVFSYADDGTRSAADGATVSGGDAPAIAGPDGRATVTVGSSGIATLRATRSSDIGSNSPTVCVNVGDVCPTRRGQTVFGTAAHDHIRGTAGHDVIRSRGGDDYVNARFGGRDRINCGPGAHDFVRVDGRDRTFGCEAVVRR